LISQTIEYALRAMVYLAGLETDAAANCETIAAHTKVPQDYLSKLLRDLVLAELLYSQRGPNGGFTLARQVSEITMLDVVNAVDPIKRIHACPLGNPQHVNLCPLHRKLDNALAIIEENLGSTTLDEILQSNRQSRMCQAMNTIQISKRKTTTNR
jgi:Rrf2 family transcriptional regulator, nitric oxide-sensitive transcriptional repressor